MPTHKPFVDFYTQHGVTPTRQDIGDIASHFQRREALHRQLGIPTALLKGSSIIEFGPGSGHNAVFWGALGPSRYVLVDATPTSLLGTRELLANHCPNTPADVVESDILSFHTDEKFDLVVCEGVIPTQLDPSSFLRHVASFAKPGGIVVTTCMDPIGVLPEVLRRIAAACITPPEMPFQDKVAFLVELFSPDLGYLPAMSRRPDDWVIDQILHPWSGPLFSVEQAIRALDGAFETLSSSPRFVTDWRWYKSIRQQDFGFNSDALACFWQNAHNLLDYRFVVPPRAHAINQLLESICSEIYQKHRASQSAGRDFSVSELQPCLERLISALDGCHESTREAVGDYSSWLNRGGRGERGAFPELWGRGQQYVSFVRNGRW